MESATEQHPDQADEATPSPPARQRHRRWRRYHAQPLARVYTPREAAIAWLTGWSNPPALVNLGLFLLLVLIFLIQASVYWHPVIDDAYITFRFVDHFVEGYGWRFNPSGPRVEGFTNFLWALLLVVPHTLGWDLMYVSKLMGLASGVLAMGASWGLLRVIRQREDPLNLVPAALLAMNTHFAHWSLMGLETLLQVALVTACYWRFEAERRDPRSWPLSAALAVLAAMTRIDSLFYLAPLGAYGLWLVAFRRLPYRRLLLWAAVAGIPFALFWLWKWNYFGDLLPNTYYAKQRLVTGHAMGTAQLEVFYLDQAGYEASPPPTGPLAPRDPLAWTRTVEALLWSVTLAAYNSFLWLNFWLIGALGLLVLAASRLLLPGLPRRFLLEPHFGRTSFLVAAPWILNLYYVWHVNGDWMPSFRFFLVALPFIGVAFGLALDLAMRVARAHLPPVGRIPVYTVLGLFCVYMLIGVGWEQMRSGSASVYDRQSVFWGPRPSGWFAPSRVASAYARGFVPPLEAVSDYLLLNTREGATIFMSDIGQPLWFASHLDLLDVDGLTDPYLSHAPSRRGRLPSESDRYRELLALHGEENLTPGRRRLLREQARRDTFQAFLDRNTRYVMEERRPEYLLIFLKHSIPGDPTSPGFAYPDIARAVYTHPARADNYVDDHHMIKTTGVFNHVFRRQDVPREIPGPERVARVLRTIERNPRMPYLVGLLYREATSAGMENLDEATRARVESLIEETFERWKGDPVVRELARLVRRGGDNSDAAAAALRQILDEDPADLATRWALSGIYQERKDYRRAAEVLQGAIPYIPPTDNAIHYHLTWLYEQAGDLEQARRTILEAISRRADDQRAWSDYAALLERAARNAERPEQQRIDFANEAITAFQQLQGIQGGEAAPAREMIAEMRVILDRLEATTGEAVPDPQATPAATPPPAPETPATSTPEATTPVNESVPSPDPANTETRYE